MANFDKYSNYNENTGVSSVVFGANSPILEVELNEMQQIQNNAMRNLLKSIIGNGIINTNKISYENNNIVISNNCGFCFGGYLVLHENQSDTDISIEASVGDCLYIHAWEEVVDCQSILYENGNHTTPSVEVENYFKDSRLSIETTKRTILCYQFDLNSSKSGAETLAIAKIDVNGDLQYLPKEISLKFGTGLKSSGVNAVAMCLNTTASGDASHAEGMETTASGKYSHAEGRSTIASGDQSHAGGYTTEALANQYTIGHYNDTTVATAGGNSGLNGTAFVIGNGNVNSKSNAFRVDFRGTPYAKNAFTTTGADYAEYFEWLDGNPDNEDRRGYFVTLDGTKIKIAKPDDYILGIVSGQPAIIGNGDECWAGRFLLDEFGAFIYEDFEYEEEVLDEETGETKTVTKTGTRYKENPEYDLTKEYIQRAERPEWNAVGMLGVLSVRDDGTCKVNSYCKVTEDGIATASEYGYRVVARVNDSIVKVIFK